jgi:hypothetical protein
MSAISHDSTNGLFWPAVHQSSWLDAKGILCALHTVSTKTFVTTTKIGGFWQFCHTSHKVQRGVKFFLKILPAYNGRMKIKVDLKKFSQCCRCLKCSSVCKHNLGPKILNKAGLTFDKTKILRCKKLCI